MAWALERVIYPYASYIRNQVLAGNVESKDALLKILEQSHKDFIETLNTELEKIKQNGDLQMNDELKKLLQLKDGSDGVQEVKKLMDSVKTLNDQVKTLESEKKELTKKVTGYETQLTDAQKEAVKLTERVAKLESTIQLRDAETFIDSQIYDKNTNSGKILPAQREAWLKSYLRDPEGTKELISGLPVALQGGEIGSNGTAPVKVKDSPDKVLSDKTIALMQEKPELDWNKAFAIVSAQNPELVRQYHQAPKQYR